MQNKLHTKLTALLLILFLPFTGFVSQTAFVNRGYSQQDISEVEWLIGTWENKTSRGSLYETWVKRSATELAGRSYMLKERDTVVFESIQLVSREGNLFYIPTVRDQNSGRPVTFLLKTLSLEKMVFENPEHDFPQIISYTRISSDSLVAEISGMRNGQHRVQSFRMRKIK